MVGAGIFSLLGAAGEVAGAAVWISFLIAGAIAGLQGYSFAKLGARYPSAGGLMEYVGRIFGADGHLTGILAWLLYAANAVVTAMVAVSFGSYASSMLADGDDVNEVTLKLFAVVVVAAMTVLNVVGSQAVARAQTVVVDRGHRHPVGVRRDDARRPSTRPCSRPPGTPRSRTSCRAWRSRSSRSSGSA